MICIIICMQVLMVRYFKKNIISVNIVLCRHISAAIFGADSIVYVWLETYSLRRGRSSHLIAVLKVSFVSHPWCFASALQHGIRVYSVSFAAHYTRCIETTKY